MKQMKTYIFIVLMAFFVMDETLAESCYIHGDPHINTTDGDAYTFAGDVTCDYILAESHRVPKFKIIGSFVECRTSCLNKITFEIRPGRKTYILGPGNVTEAGPTGGDISTITLPYSDGHETVEEEGEQIILMRNASWNSISISWNKHNSAKIEFSADRFYNSGMTGLCGDFDGSPNNDLGGVNPEDFVAANIVPGSCTEEA